MARSAYIREHQQESLHPHPLSCDLTNDSLLHRDEEFGDEHRARVSGRILFAVIALPVIAVLAAVVGAVIVVQGGGWSVFASMAVAAIFMCFVSAPILLASALKVSQDEAVRDGMTSQHPAGEDASAESDATTNS
ncbi:MAG: hypothetical protein JNM94_02315 [Phycisphaerae bacterium]|nr:hypothetical protein [Phycisphaerae bacterium]